MRGVRSAAGRSSSRDLLRAEALTYLIPQPRRRADRAVEKLETLASRGTAGAGLLSDLAGSRLVLAQERDEPGELVRALSTAERAVRADPSLQEARFNRALILEKLFLRTEAKRAWEQYLDRDPGSAWSEEARARLKALGPASVTDRWQQEKGSLRAAALRGDPWEVRRIVAISPQDAREHASEELLGGWAEAVLAGRAAAASELLQVARGIGEALLSSGGDGTVLAACQAIDRAPEPLLKSLARGHLSYREASRAFRRLDIEHAIPFFLRARDELARRTSPLELWARVGLAGADLYAARYGKAVHALREIESRGTDRFPALRGRVQWGLGMIRARQGLLVDSLRHYQEAAGSFERARETENFAAMQALAAESLRYLGQAGPAWEQRYRALGRLAGFPSSRRLHNLLWEAADAALEEGEVAAALPFQNEGLRVAERTGDPLILAEALTRRSKVLLRLGDPEGARADLRNARSHNARGRGELTRRRIGIDIAFTEGQVESERNPPQALGPLGQAVAFYREQGLFLNLAAAYLVRARAGLAAGSEDLAGADLAAAIDLFERRSVTFDDDSLLLSYSETAQALFDEMIRLHAVRRRQPLLAFEYSERARAVLLGNRSPVASTLLERPVPELRSIPRNVVFLEYALLEDRLLTWIVGQDGIELVDQPVNSRQLANEVRRFISAVRSGEERRIAASSARLYPLLLPAQARAGSQTLCFIPDKALNGLPFAALKSPAHGRYLIEERAVVLAPSVAFYLEARQRAVRKASFQSALLVGNPAFDRRLFPGLPDLGGSEREIESIQALYPKAEILRGAEATRAHLLAALDRYDVLHFSGHGVGNPLYPSSSALILATSSPDAGTLAARELEGMRLRRLRLAVLAACGTLPASQARSGSTAGLVRPFLAAGVPAVLGSLWDVEDRSANPLLLSFHRRLIETGNPASALRGAQLDSLSSPDPSLRSPGNWANFQLVGMGD